MRNLFGSLLLALSLVAGFAHALAAAPVAGTNYEVLKVAQPTSAPPGKVEVIEFFSWRSSRCYRLEVAIEAFVKKEGDRILLKRVPVASNLEFLPYSQFYYSLVSLGLAEKLTLTVYNEVFHGKYNLLSEQDQADFLATQGVDKRKFIDAHESDNVISLMEQGDDLSVGYQSDVLPTLVVAGRYKIGPVNNGPDGMTTVLEYLVKQVQDKKL